jgi:hypothetical protein
MIYSGKKDGNWGFYLAKDGVSPCVELTDQEHMALFDGQATGKIILWQEDGRPYLADPPEPTAREQAQAEIARIKAEIAARDYRALKAMKLGEDIDVLYPGETEWYKAQLARIAELESIM